MTNLGTGTGPRRVAGIEVVGPSQCPKCTSKRILGPRVVRDGEEWCNCYKCGHTWQVNKKRTNHHRKGCDSWNPKKDK